MEFANNPEELNELEAKYVTLKEIYDENCYNLKTGGEQNIVFSDKTKKRISESIKQKYIDGWLHPMLHKHHSEEAKKKMSEAKKGKYLNDKSTWYGKHLSEETKQKISESRSGKCSGENNPMYGKKGVLCPSYGRKHSEEELRKMKENRKTVSLVGVYNGMFGKHHSEETRQKIAKKRHGKIYVNNGVINKVVLPNEIPEGFKIGKLLKGVLQ